VSLAIQGIGIQIQNTIKEERTYGRSCLDGGKWASGEPVPTPFQDRNPYLQSGCMEIKLPGLAASTTDCGQAGFRPQLKPSPAAPNDQPAGLNGSPPTTICCRSNPFF